ncbi:hypothetical protein L195_g045650, partial [Trifolium pratense]
MRINSVQGRTDFKIVEHEKYKPSPYSQSSGRGNAGRGRGTRGGRSSVGRGKENDNGNINNCVNANGDEEDTQSTTYDEANHESEAGKLFFTPAQHKALLALLQGSSSLPSHSINHVTTNP